MRCFHKSVTGDLIHTDLSSIYFHQRNRKEREYSSIIIYKWSLTTCNAQFAKEKRLENRERGNPARWLTWKSPRIRINWWERQRWIMSAMQRGIILSKHGSPANTQAYTHMAWGLDKSNETLFSGYHCASLWAESRERWFKLVAHKVHFKQPPHWDAGFFSVCSCSMWSVWL